MPFKLYVTSEKRVKNARGDSDSDFAISLPYPVVAHGKCYIDVVLCANSFFLIRAGDSDKFYVEEATAGTKRVVQLAEGQYTVFTLAVALQTALNQNKAIPGTYGVSYDVTSNRLIISITGSTTANDQMTVWPEEYLKNNFSAWSGVANIGSADDPKSANRALGFTTKSGYFLCTHAAPLSGPQAPDVQPYKQLFIRSNLAGGSSESFGPNGETDIVRRVVVGNTELNGQIYDIHSQAHDHVMINGKQEFNSLWFQLVDKDGRVVDTHGLPLSFSIIFEDLE
jgi:hypothetical protein